MNLLEANIDFSLIQKDALIRVRRHFHSQLICPIFSPSGGSYQLDQFLGMKFGYKRKKKSMPSLCQGLLVLHNGWFVFRVSPPPSSPVATIHPSTMIFFHVFFLFLLFSTFRLCVFLWMWQPQFFWPKLCLWPLPIKRKKQTNQTNPETCFSHWL